MSIITVPGGTSTSDTVTHGNDNFTAPAGDTVGTQYLYYGGATATTDGSPNGGSDTVTTGSGNDTVDFSYNNGHDSITLGSGSDKAIGATSATVGIPGGAQDTFNAGSGSDTIDIQSGGKDLINGSKTAGSSLTAYMHGDTIGNDTVNVFGGTIATPNNVNILGSQGNDSIVATGVVNGTLDGQEGSNTIDASGTSTEHLIIYAGGGASTTAVELVKGGNFADQIILAGHGSATVLTDGGNDTVSAIYGNNTITTTSGHQNTITSGHNDTLSGISNNTINANGNDNIVTDNNSNNTINANGNDTVSAIYGNNIITTIHGNQNNITTGHNDTTSGISSDTINANGNDTIITESNSNNTITANGADTISVMGGNNSISTGTSNSSIYLGMGGNSTITDGATSHDTINYTYATGPVSLSITASGATATIGSEHDSITAPSNVSQFILSQHSDTVTISGVVNANINAAFGSASIDASNGTGNYTLNGAAGHDTLIGGGGTNLFEGNNDSMVGGSHGMTDQFYLGAGDTITAGTPSNLILNMGHDNGIATLDFSGTNVTGSFALAGLTITNLPSTIVNVYTSTMEGATGGDTIIGGATKEVQEIIQGANDSVTGAGKDILNISAADAPINVNLSNDSVSGGGKIAGLHLHNANNVATGSSGFMEIIDTKVAGGDTLVSSTNGGTNFYLAGGNDSIAGMGTGNSINFNGVANSLTANFNANTFGGAIAGESVSGATTFSSVNGSKSGGDNITVSNLSTNTFTINTYYSGHDTLNNGTGTGARLDFIGAPGNSVTLDPNSPDTVTYKLASAANFALAGTDTINGFAHGTDRIGFSTTQAANFSDLHITTSGGNSFITAGTNTTHIIEVAGVTNLATSDFIFG